jgi:lipoyl(octanoyl) transferase
VIAARWLPRPAEYSQVWQAMKDFTAARTPDTPDQIWLVEHSPVFTQGLAGKPEHLLAAHDVPLVQSDRGGQITYHGPGQVVAYVLLDLRRAGYFVKEYVSRVEQALIDVLAELGIADATRKAGAPGVYVPWPRPAASLAGHGNGKARPLSPRLGGQPGDASPEDGDEHFLAAQPLELAKIAALGIKVHKGCTYHGLALNVDMDLEPFGWINPCGYAGLRTVDLAACGVRADLVDAGDRLARHLARVLQASTPAGRALPPSAAAAVE